MAHTFTHLLTHLIFSTKDRLPLLDETLRERLIPYIGGIIRELGGKTIAINGTADHVHILASLSPGKSISETLQIIKGNSSRWIHDTFPQNNTFSWQVGYGAFSVSESQREDVCKYIAGQQEHHRKITFEEEFLAFLKRHNIEYDPKYLWK
jgi:REP element-mobilizing transposase RayT